MNTNKLFTTFDSKIRLSDSKREKLKTNRNALRDKIKGHFKEKKWELPSFHSQGSFSLQTNLNPIPKEQDDGSIKEKYDLDDGVYFTYPKEERKEVITYHDRIGKAVDGHAESHQDKNTCIRVIYADGHHIDLPMYWIEKDDDTPRLAHKADGFIESDPQGFRVWVEEKISDTNNEGQLRRIIRYLKAWKDYRESENSSLKLPSGFILTILACNNLSEDDRDDLSLKQTIDRIKSALELNFTCCRPTTPTDEDLLEKYNEKKVMEEIKKLADNARGAIDSECEKESSEYWRKVFGERFPLGKEADSDDNGTNRNRSHIEVGVERPWLSSN